MAIAGLERDRTWLLAQQNTLEIAKQVPAQRWLQLRYEDVVTAPEAAMRGVCSFIGIPYEAAMINPYDDRDRMTDGVASASKMSGDLKFHLHNAINPASAGRWKEFYSEDVLGTQTRELAGTLGYRPAPRGRCSRGTGRLQRGKYRQCPSEITSAWPSTTLIAVWSSIA